MLLFVDFIESTVVQNCSNQNIHLWIFQDIGVFLLEIVCKDTDLWVVAESLDSIFDVFGEDHIDPVVKEIELVQKLKMITPTLKSKVT